MRLAVALDLEIKGAGAGAAIVGGERIVAQVGIVHRMVERIEAEAVHPAIQPETHDVQQRILNHRVVDVKLGLAGEELVHIILAPSRVPGPGRAAEHRLPIIGRAAVGLGIGPDIPVGLRIGAAGPALCKPTVLIGTMGIDLINGDLQAQCVRAGNERVEIGERAEDRIDVAIIGDIIAEIAHGRGEEGRYPDRVHAQFGDMLQSLGDAVQVTHAVMIAVLKAARINLIDHRALPPGLIGLWGRFCHGWPFRVRDWRWTKMSRHSCMSDATGEVYVHCRVPDHGR